MYLASPELKSGAKCKLLLSDFVRTRGLKDAAYNRAARPCLAWEGWLLCVKSY
jgi:hypothetical protein